jgi:tRNA-dihydrouridine synthase B
MSFAIGPYRLDSRVLLAPMAGVTDPPFRSLCHRFGAALCGAEMLTSDQTLWHSAKSRRRMDHRIESGIRTVQLAGAEPAQLAEAAKMNVALGAQIIDINLGCPAKKVCDRLCGSALLSDEPLVARIFDAVVAAVDVPVTVKIRTGPDSATLNAVRVADLAQRAGIAAIAIHGRTRAQRFEGQAEYDTIRNVKQHVDIPVIANGDITTPAQALAVLEYTGADGVMIGRGAQGAPWIFQAVNEHLGKVKKSSAPVLQDLQDDCAPIILEHLESLYKFYGEHTGIRMARKHLSWYCQRLSLPSPARGELMAAADSASQFACAERWFGGAHQRRSMIMTGT